MKRILLAMVIAVLATPALAQEYNEQRIAEQLGALEAYIAKHERAAEVPIPPRQPPIVPRSNKVVLPFEDLNIFDELPDYVYSMPRQVYIKWAKMQNAGAYRKAQRMADDFAARHPLKTTYVQDNEYSADVTQEQHEEVSPTTADFSGRQSTDYRGKNRQFTFQDRRYGGGPVTLLNPYMPRPPKVIFVKGEAVIADPDNQIRTKRQAKKLLREATK